MKPLAEAYARSLLSAAESLDCLQALTGDFQAAAELYRIFERYMNSPRLGLEEKRILLRESLSDRVQPLTAAFLDLLLARRHFRYLPAVAKSFQAMAGAALGNVTVLLRLPFAPSPELPEYLKTKFAEAGLIPAGKAAQTEVKVVIDSALIGGFIASCNGNQIDASLGTVLKRLRNPERLGAR